MLWWLVAPLSLVEKRADGLYRVGGEGDESAVAADGWFAVLALAAGILAALVVYLRTRPGRVVPLLSLVAGGLVGAVVAWQTGHLLGPGPLEASARGLEVGARLSAPLDLSAYAVLLAWPMGAVITYFAVSAGAEVGDTEDAAVHPSGPPAEQPEPVEPVSPGAGEQSGPR